MTMDHVDSKRSFDSHYCRPIVGDLVLLHAGLKTSNAILAIQRLATRRLVRYSHVAICVSGLLFVHSTDDDGVNLVTFDQLLGPNLSRRNWKIIRNSKIQEQLILGSSAENDMYVDSIHFIRQEYNRAFLRQKSAEADSTSFCSELASKLFAKWGIQISTKEHTKLLPGHIELASKNSLEWIDVSWIYNRLLTDPKWAAISSDWSREAESRRKALESIADHAEIAFLGEKINRLFESYDERPLAEVRRRYPNRIRFWFEEPDK